MQFAGPFAVLNGRLCASNASGCHMRQCIFLGMPLQFHRFSLAFHRVYFHCLTALLVGAFFAFRYASASPAVIADGKAIS